MLACVKSSSLPVKTPIRAPRKFASWSAGPSTSLPPGVDGSAPATLSHGVSRLSIPEYAMALAHVASMRSEDPYRKVGAAALDFDNRVIGTAYNGLAPGFAGVWQIDVTIPGDAPTGPDLALTVVNGLVSNPVPVAVVR